MNKIKKARKELNMTQEELSFLSGVPQSEISRIETGKKTHFEIETGIKLARALGKPVEYLFPDY